MVFPDKNWSNNPDSGKSISSKIIRMSNGPMNIKVGLQGNTVQSAMEAELVAAILRNDERDSLLG